MDQLNVDNLQWNEKGLIPAIVQEYKTKTVLMMAYMNKEALLKTIATKETWFWSRSREELWHKGATSGNYQRVKEIKTDCDKDTLLVLVEQVGVACHTGSYSCFSEEQPNSEDYSILDRLAATIKQRDLKRPEGSYTSYLLTKGLDKVLKKVGEETAEVIIAAKNPAKEELIYEASDLLYHLLVLFHVKEVSLTEVLNELEKRTIK